MNKKELLKRLPKPTVDWLFNKATYLIAVGISIGLLLETGFYAVQDYGDLLKLIATSAVIPLFVLSVGWIVVCVLAVVGAFFYVVIKDMNPKTRWVMTCIFLSILLLFF